jgi:hypothetical protein
MDALTLAHPLAKTAGSTGLGRLGSEGDDEGADDETGGACAEDCAPLVRKDSFPVS